MKNKAKKLTAIIISLTMIISLLPIFDLTSFAQTTGDYIYEVVDEASKTCKITVYLGKAKDLVIPAEIDGYKVTEIGEGSICGEQIQSIKIPDTVTKIEYGAFEFCGYYNNEKNWKDGVLYIDKCLIEVRPSHSGHLEQKTLNIKKGTEVIAEMAFKKALYPAYGHIPDIVIYDIYTVNIPASVKHIGELAFTGAECVKAINVDSKNPVFSSKNGILFNKDKTELIACSNIGILKSYTIPSTVKIIARYAFFSTNIDSIIIPKSVTNISDYAFYGSDVSTMQIPDSVKVIGDGAFLNCNWLTCLSVGNGVQKIGKEAFKGCTNLESITLNSAGDIIKTDTFRECKALKSITIPKGVKTIETRAFFECSNLESVTISDGVKNIDGAFYECKSLTNVTLPDSVTSMVETFFCCESLTSVTIPNGVKNIDYSFQGCTNLSDVTIPDSVTSMVGSFFGCKSLTEVIIPNGITNINDAFKGCSNITSMTIPDSVTDMSQAFYECSSLTAIKIPDGVKNIDNSFNSCTKLSSVTIPDSVTSMCGAFQGCESLTEVTIPNGVTKMNQAFKGCTKITSVTVPDSVTDIYEAFYGCSSLTEVTIPGSVKKLDKIFYNCPSLKRVLIKEGTEEIGNNAFENCEALTSLFIPDSVTKISRSSLLYFNELTIYGHKDTCAEKFATEYNISFVAVERKELSDTSTNLSVTDSDIFAIPQDTVLNVTTVEKSASKAVYTISLLKEDVSAQPNGLVTISIPIPEELDGNLCNVYISEANGKKTKMEAVYSDGFMTFKTNRLGEYTLTSEKLDYLDGDVDGNDEITLNDSMYIITDVAKKAPLTDDFKTRADFDYNGIITLDDAMSIILIVAKKN